MNADIFGFNWTVTASPQTQIYCCNNLFIIQGPSHQWFFQASSIPNIRPNRLFWISRPLPYFFWEEKLASCPTTQQKIEASIFHLFFCDACARILRLIWTLSDFRALVQLCGFLGLISCPVRNHQSNLLLQKNDTRTSFPPWHGSKVLQVLRQMNMRKGKWISKSVRYWCLANVTWPESVVEL